MHAQLVVLSCGPSLVRFCWLGAVEKNGFLKETICAWEVFFFIKLHEHCKYLIPSRARVRIAKACQFIPAVEQMQVLPVLSQRKPGSGDNESPPG